MTMTTATDSSYTQFELVTIDQRGNPEELNPQSIKYLIIIYKQATT